MAPSTRLLVNGIEREVPLQPQRRLLTVLREELGLTGAKPGCGEGACGACTVLIDGALARACMLSVGEVAGRSVTTIEGLARGGELHPVQRAFAEVGAMQCGYCTPGMVLSAATLLATHPDPDEGQIRTAMDGNVCRCCTYPRILRAIRLAADRMHGADATSLAGSRAERPGGEPGPGMGPGPEDGGIWPARPAHAWDLLPAGERDYFALLPDGLVVVRPAGQAAPYGGAWLHVAADGRVTAFTGKVEVGQGNRTALALLVAEELCVSPAAVRLVMGDTDVCPFDMGTFGSRSIVDAGTHLREAAAAARAELLALAAERLGATDSGALTAADGHVTHAATGRSIAYGALVQGLQRVVPAEAAAPTPPREWQTAGSPVGTRAAVQVVTGARRFPSDMARPGMLYGKVLRAPAYSATLRALDVSGARAIPGVTVVHEGAFVGVAAPDPSTAQQALQAIRAEWDVPPQPGEADLTPYLRAHPVEVQSWGGNFRHETGRVEEALAAADVRLEATYTAAYIAHVPLETRAALAEWEGDRLTVWTGTQRPFGVRAELAQALGVPEAAVRVIVPPTGSGFGGKHTGQAAIEAARLARAAGRPVKLNWTRQEEFTWGYFRPAAVIDVRSGASADGTLTAWDFRNVNSGAAGITSPYDIPHQRIEYQPAASPLPQGAYRALAATANHFARESHMDELAHRLGLDPLEFRLRHLRDDRLAAVFRAAAERAGWGRRDRGTPSRGMGIAGGVEKGGRVATCAEVRVHADGRLEILRIVTAFECGAIVDPDGLTNQIEGATVMGLGGALFEAIHFEGGRILNPALSQYRVPRFSDVPPIEVVLVDRRDLPSAGAGETPIVAVAPAIANAIFAATGRRLRAMPLAPDGFVR